MPLPGRRAGISLRAARVVTGVRVPLRRHDADREGEQQHHKRHDVAGDDVREAAERVDAERVEEVRDDLRDEGALQQRPHVSRPTLAATLSIAAISFFSFFVVKQQLSDLFST